jgi:hypothetical protein
MQQRRDEILAKKAKLAELKRQREIRTREVSATRQSIGSSSDVCHLHDSREMVLIDPSSYLQHQEEVTTTARN